MKMDDNRIVELYWQRDEAALTQTKDRYGDRLLAVAQHILADWTESEETVNDTYLRAWNTMPPHRPVHLCAFLSKITRELSIDRYRRRTAEKRLPSQYALSLEELGDCVPGGRQPEEDLDVSLLARAIGDYLGGLTPRAKAAFVRRYFFADSLQEIAAQLGATVPWVKSTLHRTRKGLRTYLEKEGYSI